MSEGRPPLRARLHWYKLTSSELAFLTAVAELVKDTELYASISRLAGYSKLSVRQVQRIVGRFVHRGVLTELAPPNTEKRRPTTYRFNEEALELDPRMRRWPPPWLQRTLPGIVQKPKFGVSQPVISDSTGDTMSPVRCQQVTLSLVTPCHQSGVTTSPNPKALDPTTLKKPDPTDEIHRAHLWAEKNSYAYRAFCRELGEISRASAGVYQFDHEGAALRAAFHAGVPEHIALALIRHGES